MFIGLFNLKKLLDRCYNTYMVDLVPLSPSCQLLKCKPHSTAPVANLNFIPNTFPESLAIRVNAGLFEKE